MKVRNMMRKFKINRPLILHPFLFAIYPFLFIFSFNFSKGEPITLLEILPYMLITLGVTAFLFLAAFLILRNAKKAGILVSFVLVLFFGFGHFFNYLTHMGLFQVGGSSASLQRYWVAIFLIGVFLVFRTRRTLIKLSTGLNVTVSMLVAFSLYDITVFQLKKDEPVGIFIAEGKKNIESKKTRDTKKAPDIYYVILDGYGSEAVLQKFYNFNNRPFIDSLKERGLFVAENSVSNYPTTGPSMASTLAMTYAGHGKDEYIYKSFRGQERYDHKALLSNLEGIVFKTDYIQNILKSKGYQYITKKQLSKARECATPYEKVWGVSIDDVLFVVMKTTLLRDYAPKLMPGVYSTYSRQQACLFEATSNVKTSHSKPKFVLAHIRLPHPPFFLDANGDVKPRIQWETWKGAAWANKKGYIDNVRYANKLTIKMIDEIIANSKQTPIIVIQGDHGPAATLAVDNSWIEPEDYMIKERVGILNAYLLPNGGNDLLYDSITPVNTFRIILDHYFGGNYGRLKDVSLWKDFYFKSSKGNRYTDVTEIAYRDIDEINPAHFIVNGSFDKNLSHLKTEVAGEGRIEWNDGALQFTQVKESKWLHAYHILSTLTAGKHYQLSITATALSSNLRVSVGNIAPQAGAPYSPDFGKHGADMGMKQVYFQIMEKKKYVVNVTPKKNGPHFLVISDGGQPGQVSKVDDIKFNELQSPPSSK